MSIYSTLNQSLLHHLFNYSNGDFYWKVSPKQGISIGQKAGCKSSKNYITIKILGKHYQAHRLVFLYHNGYLPDIVDHIDGDKLNNRIENLREATPTQNQWNSKLSKSNTSGVKGVSWHKGKQKWTARVGHNYKIINLGSFVDKKDAECAVKTFRESLQGEFTNHG